MDSEFKDKEELVRSLEELNLHPEVHVEPQHLQGYRGDKRSQKAHIIVRRKYVGNASNDVGFLYDKNKQKYKVIASEFDSAWRTGKKINKLKQVYGEKVIMKGVKKNSRFSLISRKENEKGEIKIKVRRY